jgi:glycosyltransferase involved in cell wall biosynthesis
MPRVSVIIPVFNGAATVGRAIDSALAQNYRDFEVIVVNDGSNDSTSEILNGYDGKIRVIHQRQQGVPMARIGGSAAANGKYLAFLDADDVWLPDKLRKTVNALDRDPACVLAYSNVMPVDHSGRPTGELYVTSDRARPPTMEDMLRRFWPILPSSVVIERAVFDRCAGPYSRFGVNGRFVHGHEDSFLWLLAREHGAFNYVSEPLVLYRLTPLLERLTKYRQGFDVFVRLVAHRYGDAGRALIDEANAAYASVLGYRGLLAMAGGDRRAARAYFLRALHFRTCRARNFFRLTRTFLPQPLAIPLTGRTRAAYGA